jgi:hypothetical protein
MPEISINDSREKINNTINGLAGKSETALLTLYVFRQMDKIDWLPYIKASIERNPVCFSDLEGKTVKDVYNFLILMPDESIYEGYRLALPDEVWNFRRGDGIEKALLLADFIIQNYNKLPVSIDINKERITLKYGGESYEFKSFKNFKKSILITGNNYTIS